MKKSTLKPIILIYQLVSSFLKSFIDRYKSSSLVSNIETTHQISFILTCIQQNVEHIKRDNELDWNNGNAQHATFPTLKYNPDW